MRMRRGRVALGGLLLAANAAAQDGSDPEETESESAAEGEQAAQAQVGVDAEQEGDTPDSASEQEHRKREEDLGHFFQFGVRAGISFPYRIVARYEDSPPCDIDAVPAPGEEGPKVCGFGSAPALDLALSFAPLDTIEPYLWMRLGLGNEARTNTAALKVFGAGVRIYTMSESKFKLYFEPAAGFETEGAIDENAAPGANYDTDFMFHLNFGGHYDFARYVGAYLAIGVNASFVRALAFPLEANAGLQFRVP